MTLQALDVKITGQPFGLTNYGKLKDNIDWLIAGAAAVGKKTSPVTSSASTFAGGSDILATALSFEADGTSDYVLKVFGEWSNSISGVVSTVAANLDGSEAGFIRQNTNGLTQLLAAEILIPAPAAGAHTVNARIFTDGGTITVNGGAGGSNVQPILVVVERAQS